MWGEERGEGWKRRKWRCWEMLMGRMGAREVREKGRGKEEEGKLGGYSEER